MKQHRCAGRQCFATKETPDMKDETLVSPGCWAVTTLSETAR